MKQNNLRKQIRIVKALYSEDFTYKDFADYLNININSFYNWINGAYELGYTKEKKLQTIVNDILD